MTGLCPTCGRSLCTHTAKERGQTDGEFIEDLRRDITNEELEAWNTRDDSKKIAVAQTIAKQRKAGTFVPTFKIAERALHLLYA
jgi:hypothetical protein